MWKGCPISSPKLNLGHFKGFFFLWKLGERIRYFNEWEKDRIRYFNVDLQELASVFREGPESYFFLYGLRIHFSTGPKVSCSKKGIRTNQTARNENKLGHQAAESLSMIKPPFGRKVQDSKRIFQERTPFPFREIISGLKALL